MEKPHEFNAERLKNLIAEDKVLQVLEELRGYAKGRDKDMYDELIVHLNNINTVRKERGMGLISFREEQGEKNRILVRLNQLIDDLDRVYNKNRFILELRGEVEDFDETMELQLIDGLNKIFENNKCEIIAVYAGSIKVIVETQDADFGINVILFNSYLNFVNTLFKGIEILDILYEERFFKEIAAPFYGLLMRFTIFPIKKIFESLKKYILSESFYKTNLIGISFRAIDLSYVDLSGANLRGANFSGASLRGANLRSTNLRSANFSDADLRSADLKGLDLAYRSINEGPSNVDFSNADLSGADLSGINLFVANLSGANLSEANLSEANLSRVNLNGANLRRANLYDANLSGANVLFIPSSLSGADLSNTDLRGANLRGADLRDVNLSGAILSISQLLECKTLFKAKGIPPNIKQEIILTKPELFDDPNDGKKEDVFIIR